MKLFTSSATVLAGFAILASHASAALFIHEPFAYNPTDPVNNGASLGDGNQSGALGLGTWTQINSGSNEIDVAAGGLTFTDGASNVLPTSGNAFERAERVGQAAVNAPITTTGFAAEETTTWITFLFQDRGFSGPDFALALTSETILNGDAQALSAAGFGVGLGINSVGGPARAIGTAVYNNATSQSFTPEAVATFDGPGASPVTLLGVKINWSAAGDEVFVFNLSPNFLSEPAEGTALASDTFNWSQTQQDLLDNLAINESQVNFLDEVRVASTYAEAVGIPEPSSLALLGLGGLAFLRRRR